MLKALEQSRQDSTKFHKFCKNNCTIHNNFSRSLRKYPFQHDQKTGESKKTSPSHIKRGNSVSDLKSKQKTFSTKPKLLAFKEKERRNNITPFRLVSQNPQQSRSKTAMAVESAMQRIIPDLAENIWRMDQLINKFTVYQRSHGQYCSSALPKKTRIYPSEGSKKCAHMILSEKRKQQNRSSSSFHY